MNQYDSQHEGDEDFQSVLLSLPTELLVYIITFLPTSRERVNLRYVSNKLRTVAETPSLWSELAWPYYHSDDEGRLYSLLKVCGLAIKHLLFPDHVTPATLVKLTKQCSSVTDLSIPTTKLDSEQLKQIIQHTSCLQRLDIPWNFDIKQLLLITGENVKELTIRAQLMKNGQNCGGEFNKSIDSWLQHWLLDGFKPENLNIVVNYGDSFFWTTLYDELMETWTASKPLHGCDIGCIKFYTTTKCSLNLYTVTPQFQLEFGEPARLPHISASQFGLHGLNNDVLVLTSSTIHSETICAAKVDNYSTFADQLNNGSGIASLNLITEFDLSFENSFCSLHLEQLAMLCPNLQRLKLCCVRSCLKSLQGLRTIASNCHSLQGLNLMCIPVTEVENHLQLWEILSDMKLTYLAMDLCLFVSSVERETLARLYKKCTNLLALESSVPNCHKCWNVFTENSTSLFSYFPMLKHCVFNVDRHCCETAVHDLITSCNKLKCLYYCDRFGRLSLSVAYNSNLQQIYINAGRTDIPDNFMNSLSAHGGLVYVVLCVRSTTSEGITKLVVNSPRLITFHVVVNQALCDNRGTSVDVSDFVAKMKSNFSCRSLFKLQRFKILQRDLTTNIDQEYVNEHNADLLSLW